MFKVNNKNTRTISPTSHWTYISYIFLLFLLLTWSKQMFAVFKRKVLNPFVPNAPFLYSLKTSEKRKVFWCFERVEKGCIGSKWVKVIFWVVVTIIFKALEELKFTTIFKRWHSQKSTKLIKQWCLLNPIFKLVLKGVPNMSIINIRNNN